jgi:hypothetical protein
MALGTASSMSFSFSFVIFSRYNNLMSDTTTGYHSKLILLRMLFFGSGGEI